MGADLLVAQPVQLAARQAPQGLPTGVQALVQGSMLRLHTDILGTLVIAEEGPDLSSTAYGVIADLFEILAAGA